MLLKWEVVSCNFGVEDSFDKEVFFGEDGDDEYEFEAIDGGRFKSGGEFLDKSGELFELLFIKN